MTITILCVFSFLIGGIPFGYLVGQVILKDDIRKHGSGNIGATNVARVIGWKWGSTVLVLDALKGLLPTLAASRFASISCAESLRWHVPVAVGICTIVGHMYPVYLKLRGGKGVATAMGVVVVLAPVASAIAAVSFLVIAGSTRIVALASMIAAVVFGAAQLWLLGTKAVQSEFLSVTAFAIAIPVLIIWRHRSNIQRMLSGSEPAVTDRVTVEE